MDQRDGVLGSCPRGTLSTSSSALRPRPVQELSMDRLNAEHVMDLVNSVVR